MGTPAIGAAGMQLGPRSDPSSPVLYLTPTFAQLKDKEVSVARSSAGMSSLERAVLILDAFDEGTRDQTASEIAAKAEMPLSTAHRLLGELVAVGLIEPLPDRRYRIGLRLWELAVRTPGALGIREIATPYLRQAHAAIGQSLQLGILEGREMLYLERLSAPRAVVNYIIVGGRIPFHATSSGLVMAAYMDSASRESLLGEELKPYAKAPILGRQEMTRQLTRIREQGYATTRGYIHPDATSIAVPVHAPLGGVVAAISAIVPTEEPHEAAVLEVLIPTSKAISGALQRHYRGESYADPRGG